MGKVVQLSYLPQLREHCTVEWDDAHVVGIVVQDLLDNLVCLRVVLLVEVLFCFNLANIEVLLLLEDVEHGHLLDIHRCCHSLARRLGLRLQRMRRRVLLRPHQTRALVLVGLLRV